MPTSITIPDLPDQTRQELEARAGAVGRSLEDYLRAKLVELARQPDPGPLIARVRDRQTASGSTLTPDQILAIRERDLR